MTNRGQTLVRFTTGAALIIAVELVGLGSKGRLSAEPGSGNQGVRGVSLATRSRTWSLRSVTAKTSSPLMG